MPYQHQGKQTLWRIWWSKTGEPVTTAGFESREEAEAWLRDNPREWAEDLVYGTPEQILILHDTDPWVVELPIDPASIWKDGPNA